MIFSILADIKSYLKIKIKYPRLYPSCEIKSLIPVETAIGKGVIVKEHVYISSASKSMDDFVYIGDGTSIFECDRIGKFSCISHGVKIGLSNHPLDHIGTSGIFFSKSRGWVEKSTFSDSTDKRANIGCDVLISANAMILNGVKIGHGAVIGAGAFVNKDIPPYAIVVGNPATILRYRFSEQLIERLLKSQWWDFDESKLRSLAPLFNQPEKFLEQIELA